MNANRAHAKRIGYPVIISAYPGGGGGRVKRAWFVAMNWRSPSP